MAVTLVLDILDRLVHGNPRVGPQDSRAALLSERRYWRRWIRTRGREWGEGLAERLDPLRPFPHDLRRELGADPPDPVRVLDVGSGPITTVGRTWPGHTVEVVAVDPLAHDYKLMLEGAGIAAPVAVGLVG